MSTTKRITPSQAKPSQAKPSQAKQSQAKPSQAKQSKAKQSKAKQSKAKQNPALTRCSGRSRGHPGRQQRLPHRQADRQAPRRPPKTRNQQLRDPLPQAALLKALRASVGRRWRSLSAAAPYAWRSALHLLPARACGCPCIRTDSPTNQPRPPLPAGTPARSATAPACPPPRTPPRS